MKEVKEMKLDPQSRNAGEQIIKILAELPTHKAWLLLTTMIMSYTHVLGSTSNTVTSV